MLNKLYISLGCILTLSVVGCTDLEDVVVSNTTETSATSALASTYQQLSALTNQANTYAMLEHPSDEMLGPTRGTDWDDNGTWRRLHLHTWDATHNQVQDAWDDLGTGVVRATVAVEAASDNAPKQAEARFLRAFFMHYIVDLYGKVQIREAGDDPDSNPVVLSRSAATDFIINDLRIALKDLPAGSPSTSSVASKDAAEFLLAKMYLNKAVYKQDPTNPAGPFAFAKADMDSVAYFCNQIIASGNYELVPSGRYFDNFHWNNKTLSQELIFTLENSAGNTGRSVRNRYYMTLHYNQQPSGWNGFTTLADFYDSFEDNDDRLGGAYVGLTDKTGMRAGFLVGQQVDQTGKPLKDRAGNSLSFTKQVSLTAATEAEGIRVIKYLPQPSNFDNLTTNYVFFRYADVFLMYAEAILRGGVGINGATSKDLINAVRSNRNLSDLQSVSLSDILSERGHELYWEGFRRSDQIRFGEFLEPDGANVINGRASKSPDFRTVFPIPQRAIDANPNLSQNFGY